VSPAGAIYSFGAFEIDGRTRELRRNSERVSISDRYISVLLHLAAHAGTVVTKDDLVQAGWGDVAVGDNSLEQAISTLRRVLGRDNEGRQYVETVPRQGYRLSAAVSRKMTPASDDAIEALLAPYRALIDGRAALETLEREQILRARDVFARIVATTPDATAAHVGLAYACALQFEMTRADAAPNVEALQVAVKHGYEACRLDTENAEAWSTLSFILERVGRHGDAVAAGRRAIALEPQTWGHHFRLASIAWGEERLRAARRTLSLLPGLGLAHWLAASVLVARHMLDEAQRELETAIAVDGRSGPNARYSSVALHWLLGLLHFTRGDHAAALASFDRELANESSGHLYARECCANTSYAIGAVHLREGRNDLAAAAFAAALARVPGHRMARVGLAAATSPASAIDADITLTDTSTIDDAFLAAAVQVLRGSPHDAAALVERAFAAAPPSNAGWLLPIEPLLNVGAAPDAWAAPLARLRVRAT
jgi:DNA-binding winged helix-turn-helix (wHTH) protein